MNRSPMAPDMTGRRFGQLTVVERAGRDHRRAAMWACRCECGEATTARGRDLRAGERTSCGHESRLIDMAGQTFGWWAVQGRAENLPVHGQPYGETAWHCRCRCGTERAVAANNLRRGRSMSCGCRHSTLHVAAKAKAGAR